MSWRAGELRWALEHWQELALYTRPKPRLKAPPRRRRDLRPPVEFVTAERLVDLERALGALRAEDRELASVVVTAYLRPDLMGLARTARVALWAIEHGVSATTAWRRLERAERRLLELLNGEREAPAPAGAEAGGYREGEVS